MTDSYSTNRPNALLVDDNTFVLAMLSEQLDKLGYNCCMASDGVEALVKFGQSQFDIVITDINMPRMDGYALTLKLREQEKHTPIIGITANPLSEMLHHALQAGMDTWLTKPISLTQLKNCLLDTLKNSSA
nr:hypothetical protein FFPRI1PSEUD_24360 [Pseudomonas sp. FFPRI_1]